MIEPIEDAMARANKYREILSGRALALGEHPLEIMGTAVRLALEIERYKEVLRDIFHSPGYVREVIRQELGIDESRGDSAPKPSYLAQDGSANPKPKP